MQSPLPIFSGQDHIYYTKIFSRQKYQCKRARFIRNMKFCKMLLLRCNSEFKTNEEGICSSCITSEKLKILQRKIGKKENKS